MRHVSQIVSEIELLQVKHSRERQTMEWREFSERCKAAANYACQICKQRKPHLGLVVHHPFYDPGRRLWDYELHEVQVLCGGGEEGCHAQMHAELEHFRRFVWPQLTPMAMRKINGALSVALRAKGAAIVANALVAVLSDEAT